MATALLWLGACLDETTHPIDPDNPDAVRFAVDAVYVGAQVQTSELELNGAMLKAWLADPAATGGFRQLPITFLGTTALAEVPQGAEGLWQLTLGPPFDDFLRVFPITDGTRSWHAVATAASSATPAVPPANATIKLKTSLHSPVTPSDRFTMWAVGPWATHTFQQDEVKGASVYEAGPISYSANFLPLALAVPTLVGPSATEPQLHSISRNDRVYVIRSQAGGIISAAAVPPFELVDGENVIDVAQIPIVENRTLNATFSTADAPLRLQPLTAQGAELVQFWRIHAAPISRYTSTGGPRLIGGAPQPSINIAYGNPYAGDGLEPTLSWVTEARRIERDDDGMGWVHTAGLHIDDSNPTSGRVYAVDAGLPTSISLNGVVLNTDKTSVAVGLGQPLELSFTADRIEGEWRSMDCYRLEIAGGRPTPKLILSLRLLTDRIRIPVSMLPRGPRYICRMHLVRGSNKAQQGDDREREPSLRFGFLDSASFVVP